MPEPVRFYVAESGRMVEWMPCAKHEPYRGTGHAGLGCRRCTLEHVPPKRIRMTRQHPWRSDNPHAVIVSRPSKFGNVFRVTSTKETRRAPRWWHVIGPRDSWSYLGSLWRARGVATDEFRRWVTRPALSPYDFHWTIVERHVALRTALDAGELRGRDLACWCPLDEPCHADVLLELANRVA